MAGRSMASNLSGMLGSIGDTLGKMGDTGNQYVDTFRRLQAPEADMNDSASLLQYADWARRNGYDDEAKQYMVLGATQKKVEEQKAYKTSVATGTEKLRKTKAAVARVNAEIARQEKAGVVNPQMLNARDALVSAYSQTADNLDAMGNASNYGIGNEGAEAIRTINAYEYEQEKQRVQMANLKSTALENFQDQLDRGFSAGINPNMYMDPAQQKTYEAAYRAAEQTVAETFGRGTEQYNSRMIKFNKDRGTAAQTQNEKYWTKVEAQAVKLGELGVQMLLDDLDRETPPTSSFGGKIANFVKDVFTDQADVYSWAENTDNQALIQKAIERVAQTAPYTVSNWENMAPSDKLKTIQDEVIRNLKMNPAFAEEYEEDLDGQKRDRDGAEAATNIQDLSEGTNTQQYQEYLADLDQQYINAGMGGIQSIRENNPDEWARVRANWKKIWDEMEGTGLNLPSTGPLGQVPSPPPMPRQ